MNSALESDGAVVGVHLSEASDMVVCSREKHGSRRRACRGSVELRKDRALVRKPLEHRRRDLASVRRGVRVTWSQWSLHPGFYRGRQQQ